MDMLGFKKQLVFATHSVVTPFRDLRGKAKYVDKQGVQVTPELGIGRQELITGPCLIFVRKIID